MPPELLKVLAKNPPVESSRCRWEVPDALKARGVAIREKDRLAVLKKSAIPKLKLRISTGKRTYMVGEPILVTLRYEYSGQESLYVYFHSDGKDTPIAHLESRVLDSSGHKMPRPQHMWGSFSHGRSVEIPTDGIHELTTYLNDGVTLDRPGRYAFTVLSPMINCKGNCPKEVAVPESNPLEIEIIPADESFVKNTLVLGEKLLRHEDAEPLDIDMREIERRVEGIRLLGFLFDERAIRMMLPLLDEYLANVADEAFFEFRRFPDKKRLEEILLDSIERGAPATEIGASRYGELLANIPDAKYPLSEGQWSIRLKRHIKSSPKP
ncbi:MAG: hypothetical protein A3J79_07385 [Elusimicrobia bacterium RIFOXYB2_FULL_62_6]|nr:MAG: hypothetical protein A3J79_07385 [Elusimicrobia bacterium RIFOXYB2_FULL_62_6]